MSELETPKEKKHISISKSQLGFGSAIVMAIMILNPVKEWFFTREEGRAQAEQIAQLRVDLAETKDELTRRLERNADKIIEQIKDSEERSAKNQERIERRVEMLEASAKRKSNNNL